MARMALAALTALLAATAFVAPRLPAEQLRTRVALAGRARVTEPVLEASMALALTCTASAAVGLLYPHVVQVLGFRSKLRELIFGLFSACSVLWFLAPSHWAHRVAGRLRPAALRCAACGWRRSAAWLLAFTDFARYAITAGQGLFAARLAAEALPSQATRLLPLVPHGASLMTSDLALRAMGPWLGPPTSMGAWSLELISVLLRRHSLQLLFVLTALPLARCLWRALEAPPLPQRRPGDWIHEAFRSLLAGSVAVLGLYGAVSLGGRAWSWHLLLAAVAFLQPLQDLLARGFIAIHRLKMPQKQLKGFVGGVLLNGTVQGFRGLDVEVQTQDGVVLIPAAHALRLAKRKPLAPLQLVTVPSESLLTAMAAARKALTPGSKKKKLMVIPLALGLLLAAKLKTEVAQFAYAFALSMYLSAFVLPKPLVLALSVSLLSFHGPVNSISSKAMALGLLLSAVKPKPKEKLTVACTSLDLAKDEATLAFRGASKVVESVQEAIEEKAKGKPYAKKQRIKGAIYCVLSVVLLAGVTWWKPLVFSIEEAVAQRGARLLIFGLSAGISLRLLQYAIIPQAARFALPAGIGAACSGPGKTAHWFLAVNSRTAAASAAAAFLLPQVGLLQTLAFHLQLRPQILWVDAWVHQISLAFLGAVCAVQLAKIMNRRLPQRPSNWLIRSCCALGKSLVLSLSSGLLTHFVLLAAAAPGPLAPSLLPLEVGVVTFLLALLRAVSRNWLQRGFQSLSSSETFWVRASGRLQAARLLGFKGSTARLSAAGAELQVPAAELRGTAVRHLRPVRVALPGGESLAQRLRHSLKQQLGLIQRAPLAPEVWVEEDQVKVIAFLDRSAHPREAADIRSNLLLSAASAG